MVSTVEKKMIQLFTIERNIEVKGQIEKRGYG